MTDDVMASNSVNNVIDNVILPAEPEPLGDVVDVAVAAGNFKTLVQIIVDLRLVDILKGLKAQTIFAPSDEAFAKLPEGTLANLTNQQKFEIVARHVVSNITVPKADVETGPLKTLGGEVIDIIRSRNIIQIEYKGSFSTIMTADVMASNGVIHVIDNVILPAPTTTTTITTTTPQPTPMIPGINICFPDEFDSPNGRSTEPIAQLNIVICGENEVCQPIGDGELAQYG